ncbi:MAG: deoxyguanosinetriphosphate triphosphohydrolase [Nocardioidaceae bacterium]|nr:deoxyguanosinetriphosphate triphosphohydrolase [Nocardioidaceae bacterium]
MDSAPDLPGYPADALRRIVDEPTPKRTGRSAFERDRARVLHAASLRRLAAKTQVVGPGTDDFVRNRLTHSLEVGQVARELGKAVGCDPDLVETAALAHDLGHPPYGHNGERVLDELTDTAGGFEGNAQTLRILTRLEAKATDASGRSVGLNLTRATLDACVKYPWARGWAPDEPNGRTEHKFGVYGDDRPVFDWVRAGVDGAGRCMEAQVMDLADDVAYSVHDVEDGIVAGPIDLGRLDDAAERAAVFATVRDWYLPVLDDDRLGTALSRLRELPQWPQAGFDGSRGSLAGLKWLTSALIGRFVETAQRATHAAYGAGPLTRHRADLVVPAATREEIAVLKGIAAHYVMRTEDRAALLDRQRELLAALVGALCDRAPDVLEPPFAADWVAAADDAGRLRVVVDQVASLTDASALLWHDRLAVHSPAPGPPPAFVSTT